MSFVHFLIELLAFLLLSKMYIYMYIHIIHKYVSYIHETYSPLSDMQFATIFSQSVACFSNL